MTCFSYVVIIKRYHRKVPYTASLYILEEDKGGCYVKILDGKLTNLRYNYCISRRILVLFCILLFNTFFLNCKWPFCSGPRMLDHVCLASLGRVCLRDLSTFETSETFLLMDFFYTQIFFSLAMNLISIYAGVHLFG